MSMNAIKGAQPINNMYAVSISNMIITALDRSLSIKSATLGSTGKKPDEGYSGDIDIAVEMEMNDENIGKLKDFLLKTYSSYLGDEPQFREMKGLNILSVGFHYEYGIMRVPMIVQIDFMFTDNLEYTKFIYHSPDFRKNESGYKGLYRTNLMMHIVDLIPTSKEPVYVNDELTDYWKYSLSFEKGLKLTHKTYTSPKTGKLLKNPITVKEDDQFITKDVNTAIETLFGPKATVKDFNSFESIIKFMFSDKFMTPDIIPEVIKNFINDKRHEERHLDIIKYILNVLMKKATDEDKEFLVLYMSQKYVYNLSVTAEEKRVKEIHEQYNI